MTANGAPLPAIAPSNKHRVLEEDEEDSTPSMNEFWKGVRNRYKSESMDPTALASPLVDELPNNWTVVNISVTDDKTTLLISRQRPRREPLVFCLPLDRQGRRDSEEENLSFEKTLEEFEDIISSSDRSTKNAYLATDKESRANWWAERSQLDARLKDLLDNIEFCWLGAFKVCPEFCTTSIGL
jgi:separase